MSEEPRDSPPVSGDSVKEESKPSISSDGDGLWKDFMKDIEGQVRKPVLRNSTGGLGSFTSVIKKEKQSPLPQRKRPEGPPRKASGDLFDLTTEFVPSKSINKTNLSTSLPKSSSSVSTEANKKETEEGDDKETATMGTSDSEETKESSTIPAKRPSGSLSSIMSSISAKKSKVGCLDKSKVEWDDFVEKEGLKEELATFNRGKNGFVEKQMFLERADHRRFELEKGAREKTRKSQV